MEIYILRHGIAEERGEADDANRALTAEGRQRLGRVLERARKVKAAPSLILSSPYKRALETAEIAARILHYENKIVRTDALLPGAAPEALWEEIRRHRNEAGLMATGHEPMLSAAVAWLLGAPGIQVDLKKGALVRIDLDNFGVRPRGELRWMLTPRLAGANQ